MCSLAVDVVAVVKLIMYQNENLCLRTDMKYGIKMQELEKGKYATTDNYVAHALINPHGIYVLLVTNRRILYLKRDELFGSWAVRK